MVATFIYGNSIQPSRHIRLQPGAKRPQTTTQPPNLFSRCASQLPAQTSRHQSRDCSKHLPWLWLKLRCYPCPCYASCLALFQPLLSNSGDLASASTSLFLAPISHRPSIALTKLGTCCFLAHFFPSPSLRRLVSASGFSSHPAFLAFSRSQLRWAVVSFSLLTYTFVVLKLRIPASSLESCCSSHLTLRLIAQRLAAIALASVHAKTSWSGDHTTVSHNVHMTDRLPKELR